MTRQRSRLIAVLTSMVLMARTLAAQPYPVRCGTGVSSGAKPGYVPLPRGDVFCPLMADPKSVHSFATMLNERSDSLSTSRSVRIASVGIGDRFGLGRWGGPRVGDGAQLSLTAAVFAQFDLGATSFDLLNSDFVVGLPLTIRRGAFSTRVRVYHQSSHLGDEFLLREPANRRDRVNLSFESLEWIVSLDGGPLRAYGGGEWLVNREPSDLAQAVAHAGVELRPTWWVLPLGHLGGFRVVAGTDVKASKEHDWKPSVSARAGFEYDRAKGVEPPGRRWAILAEYYAGPSPYGQFYNRRVRYIGLGLHFGGF